MHLLLSRVLHPFVFRFFCPSLLCLGRFSFFLVGSLCRSLLCLLWNVTETLQESFNSASAAVTHLFALLVFLLLFLSFGLFVSFLRLLFLSFPLLSFFCLLWIISLLGSLCISFVCRLCNMEQAAGLCMQCNKGQT